MRKAKTPGTLGAAATSPELRSQSNFSSRSNLLPQSAGEESQEMTLREGTMNEDNSYENTGSGRNTHRVCKTFKDDQDGQVLIAFAWIGRSSWRAKLADQAHT